MAKIFHYIKYPRWFEVWRMSCYCWRLQCQFFHEQQSDMPRRHFKQSVYSCEDPESPPTPFAEPQKIGQNAGHPTCQSEDLEIPICTRPLGEPGVRSDKWNRIEAVLDTRRLIPKLWVRRV